MVMWFGWLSCGCSDGYVIELVVGVETDKVCVVTDFQSGYNNNYCWFMKCEQDHVVQMHRGKI